MQQGFHRQKVSQLRVFLQNHKRLPFLITFYHFGVKPPLVKMLSIIIRAIENERIITAFNLIIFYCLTTVYNIRFFKYFPLHCFFLMSHLVAFQNLLLKKIHIACCRNEVLSPPPEYLTVKKDILIIILRGFTRENTHEDQHYF